MADLAAGTRPVDHSAVRGIKGCGSHVRGQEALMWAAFDCDACLSLLVEGIVALEHKATIETMEARLREFTKRPQAEASCDDALGYKTGDQAVSRTLADRKEEG